MKEIPFKEIDFDSMKPGQISFSWVALEGYVIYIREEDGSMSMAHVPQSLRSAIANYCEGLSIPRTASDL